MGQIWFGSIDQAEYVPAPEAGMDADMVGAEESLSYTSGGLFVSASPGYHREYNMQWGLSDRKYMDWLFRWYSGEFGRNLLYFVDPFTTNALPPHWASPGLSADGWPSLIDPNIPATLAETPANNYGLPRTAATYAIADSTGQVPHRQLVLLIPSDKNLHVGFNGTTTNGAALRVTPVLRNGSDAPTETLTLLGVNSPTRVNKSFSGNTYSAVRIFITSDQVGVSTITLYSGKAMYTATTEAPVVTGMHQAGMGHTGLRFMTAPSISYIQAARGKQLVKTNTKFGEVGAWL